MPRAPIDPVAAPLDEFRRWHANRGVPGFSRGGPPGYSAGSGPPGETMSYQRLGALSALFTFAFLPLFAFLGRWVPPILLFAGAVVVGTLVGSAVEVALVRKAERATTDAAQPPTPPARH